VYAGSARFCVAFISTEYAQKVWARHELRNAFAKALEEKQEYVLPARFDGTEIPGLRQQSVTSTFVKRSPANS
jgi:hypothetical protein